MNINKLSKVKQKKLFEVSEEIRNTATSPEHLIQLIETKFLEFGLQIIFEEYPSQYDLNVSNSHNSPKGYSQNWCGNNTKNGVPTGYPGWSGKFKGSVKILDNSFFKEKEITLSDLTSWSNNSLLWYINTGTGCPGKDFSIGGVLWVYDFPLIHEEFKNNLDEFHNLEVDYLNFVKSYSKNFEIYRDDYIESDAEYDRCIKYQKELNETQRILNQKIEQKKLFLKNEYNKKYGKVIPIPSKAFCRNTTEIMKIHGDLSFNANTPSPELEKLFSKLETLCEDINNYINENPEKFI